MSFDATRNRDWLARAVRLADPAGIGFLGEKHFQPGVMSPANLQFTTERLRSSWLSNTGLACRVTLVLLCLLAETGLCQVNLLPQGNFEQPELRAEWAEGFNIPDNQECRIVAEEGRHWLRMENRDPNQALDSLHAYVDVAPNMVSLTVSARLKATHLETGKEGWHTARIALRFEGGAFGYPPEVPELRSDSDWVTKTVELSVPPGATRLNIQPAMFYCTGVFEIADLTVTPRLSEAATSPTRTELNWEELTIKTLNAKRSRASLDGIWRFAPHQEGAALLASEAWAYLKVPGDWSASRGDDSDFVARGKGPEWELYDGTRVTRAWYEREVLIPADWKDRQVNLHFERVSTDAIIYVNGDECGRIAWPWGAVNITPAVTPGQTALIRVLVAAIADEEQVGTFWQNALSSTVTYSSASLRSRGLTGSVFLESRWSGAQVSDVFVRTSTRKQGITLEVELADIQHEGPAYFVADMLNEKGELEKSFAVAKPVEAMERQTITLSWPWKRPRLWDVGQPNLYTLRLRATGPGLDDEYDQPFGFREFWIEGRKLFLNGTEIRLRQPCFYYGPRMQVGDTFSEFGSHRVDARGDPSDASRHLDRADQTGYLAAVYILDANKYLMNRNGRIVWKENRHRALERASVWMRHYRNHPSVVMWIAGFNFFNNAVDADPRHLGRRDWGLHNDRWQRLMVAGEEMFDGLRKLDPTRVYYSHAGAYTGDVYTMNCYLNLLPLQEREDWLSAWAESGKMPIAMVEFGTPMDCTFRRAREGFTSNITSEPLLTEFAAIYLGPEAYTIEEPEYRRYLHDLFREGMLYGSSENRLDEYANNHRIQRLYRTHTWRSWRTAGLSGGLRTWSWMQDALQEVNGPTLAWIAGPPQAYTAKDHHFGPGQRIEKQIVLINDTRQPQNFTADWTVTVAGKQVNSAKAHGNLAVSEIRFIPFQVIAPTEDAGSKVDGRITLNATIGETRHQDTFAFRVFGEDKPSSHQISVADANGRTIEMLASLGYRTSSIQPSDNPPIPSDAPIVVIGRNALKDDPVVAARLEPYIRAGGRALIFAQDPVWMTKALGWRVCPKVARRVFPIPSATQHSTLSTFQPDDLRDWSGNSTLIEAYPEYVGDYLRGNEREQPYAGWHWGNRGGVSSAAIEKPHCSGWRPLLECEFDLAYTPMMELDYGLGRMIVCTLDLEDHASQDPAARRTAKHVVDYALHAPLSPRVNKVTYLGGPTGAAWLDNIGVSYQRSATLDPGAGLLLIGPDAVPDATALTAYLEEGGKVFFLPRSQADGWLGTTLRPAPAHFAGSLSTPEWPEARGLSASDLRWRSYLDAPPWLLSDGADIGADGLIGRKELGKGIAVFCQVDPDCLRADEKTYFRYTRWRATRVVAQLLANLGATFHVDSRVFHPLDTWTLNLDGPWQMQATLKLTPATKENVAFTDPGVTPEAEKLIGENVPAEGWTSVTLPQTIPFFMDHDGEAVFRKQVVIPTKAAGKDLLLELGALTDLDTTCFNGVEVGRTDITTTNWAQTSRTYVVPGRLVKVGSNVIAVRLFNRFGPGGFASKPGFPMGPDGNRSGRQATGPGVGLEMTLRLKPQGAQSLTWYHPDYRTDFHMGDNPYRYYRW
jgi:beta-galactosidase